MQNSDLFLFEYKNTNKFINPETNYLFNEQCLAIGKILDGKFWVLTKKDSEKCKQLNFKVDDTVVEPREKCIVEKNILNSKEYKNFKKEEEEHLKFWFPQFNIEEINGRIESRWIDNSLKSIYTKEKIEFDNEKMWKIRDRTENLMQKIQNEYINIGISTHVKFLDGIHNITLILKMENLYLNFSRKNIDNFEKRKNAFNLLKNLFTYSTLKILLNEGCIFEGNPLESISNLYSGFDNMNNHVFDIFECVTEKIDIFINENILLLKIILSFKYIQLEKILKNIIVLHNTNITEKQLCLQLQNKLILYFSNIDTVENDIDLFLEKYEKIENIKKEIIHCGNKLNIQDFKFQKVSKKSFLGPKDMEYMNLFKNQSNSIIQEWCFVKKKKYISKLFEFFLEFLTFFNNEIVYNYEKLNFETLFDYIKNNHLTYFYKIQKYIDENIQKFQVIDQLEKIKDNLCKNPDKKCTLCLDNENIIAFLPCGHKITCSKCAFKLINNKESSLCPICRKEIISIARIFES